MSVKPSQPAPEPDEPAPLRDATCGRVTLTADSVRIGTEVIPRKSLEDEWGPWGAVERGLKLLKDPAFTAEELAFLGQVARGPNGRNGYNEVVSALGRSRR